MRLPKNLLSPGTYAKPRIFLCETDKSRMCQLDTTNTNGKFKFNAMSELSFDVARLYNDVLTGETKVNPFYDRIEALRLIEVEGFGFFEIQGPKLTSDGIKEIKNITAYSYEYTLSQKYLEDFNINTGKIDSLEVLNADDPNKITPITLYNPDKPKLSLLHLALEKAYGWSVGYVDDSLKTLSRQFEVQRQSIYDFITTEICEKFNCYVIFDTINNTINVYAESLTAKFIGDGAANIFTISPPFADIGTVSVDGYKTTRYQYDTTTGNLTLLDVPGSGVHIEVIDGAMTKWETDVFVTFENLSQQIDIDYDADSIKTVLTVTYGDDLNIRETNMGLPHLTDISYYHTVDWMGQDLYDAYTAYANKSNANQSSYTDNHLKMLDLSNKISFEENRLSLEYSIAQSVTSTTVGTYYVRGGDSPDYYYTEVTLPADYVAGTTYYSQKTANLDETKVSNLYTVLKQYFNNDDDWKTELDKLSDSFEFMEDYTLNWLKTELDKVTSGRTDSEEVSVAIKNFLLEMWYQVGKTPLKSLYHEAYKQVQTTNMSMEPDENGKNGGNWSNKDHPNYPFYYPVTLYLDTIEQAISQRENAISIYQSEYDKYQKANSDISNSLAMDQNFTPGQLIRLNAFLREDELHLDDIIETSQTSVNESFKLKQNAMESGNIELQKLCQPQLHFSMTMANIYALPEFEPIIDQFQLGNVIKVRLRSDYIKQSRLLSVDLNFDDFSNFSCEFGDLTNLRTQSDIHADLLANAVSAGKSVAANSSYWTKGADRVTDIDLRLQEGLLNSIEALKAIDGTQHAYLDKYGLHLEIKDPITGEVGDKRVWMVNNQIVFTDDGFKTSKAALGEFKIGDTTHYGLLAQAVLAGYIEGSQMVGGTINIGKGAFVVNEDGSVTMNGGNTIKGYTTEDDVAEIKNNLQGQIDDINNTKMYRVEISTSDSLIIDAPDQTATLTCKIYSWDTDITNQYQSYIRWIRTSSDTDGDTAWNSQANHKGVASITIGPSDIVANASFHCEVDMPD